MEDLPGVPQLTQVQEDEGQHQHHLLSPGWTVEQVQITLDDSDHRRGEEGQGVSDFFLGDP